MYLSRNIVDKKINEFLMATNPKLPNSMYFCNSVFDGWVVKMEMLVEESKTYFLLKDWTFRLRWPLGNCVGVSDAKSS